MAGVSLFWDTTMAAMWVCENALLIVQLERFSFECRKNKSKVITLANHKEHTQYSEPIKTRSNYM